MNPSLWPAQARVILTALPTYLAATIAVLAVVVDQVVPLLPEEYGAQLAGYIATAIGGLTAVIHTIAHLTPAEPGTEGVLPPPVVES